MNGCDHRALRRIALAVAVATLVSAATTAAAGSDGSNAILRNDVAHYGNRGGHSTPSATPVQRESRAPIVVRVDEGFDWVSAGVGAAGGLGLGLALFGAASTLRRRPSGDEAPA